MIVFRLSKSKYCRDLSGKGAETVGGRWNNVGTPLIYTSESIALCTAEIAVHLPLGMMPDDYKLVHIEIPSNLVNHEIKVNELPKDWKSFPYKKSTCIVGDKLVSENKWLFLKVPSAVVQGSFNYLINPRHKQFSKVKIIKTEAFEFDSRLFIKSKK
ncbi:MAG: RES domain-containing protein [Bacteroidota bacterium]